jgi:hypothetical protein
MRARRTRFARAVALGSLCLAGLTAACNLLLSNHVLEVAPDAGDAERDAPGDHLGHETGSDAASDTRPLDASRDSDATTALVAAACDGGIPHIVGGENEINGAFCSVIGEAPGGSTRFCDDFDRDAFADWWGTPSTAADGSATVDLDPSFFVSPGDSLGAKTPDLGEGEYIVSLQTTYTGETSVRLELDLRVDAWPDSDDGNYANVATLGVNGGNDHVDVQITTGNIQVVTTEPEGKVGGGNLALHQWVHVFIMLSGGGAESIGVTAAATDLCSGVSIFPESLALMIAGSTRVSGYMGVGLPFIYMAEGGASWSVNVDNVTFLTTP